MVLPLSDFLRITLLLRDNSLRAWRSPVDILSFGLSNSILASSNFTSSRKVSRATDGWTPRAGLVVPSPTSRGKDKGLQLGVAVHEFMLISICQCLCHIMKVS